MNATFKIGLVFINTNNIGDIVIADTSRYLIERTLKASKINNYKIIPIDIGEKKAGKHTLPKSFANAQKKRYGEADSYIQEWKSSKLYHYFLQNEMPKLDRMDLIVFAGGGLIKFHEQFFHMYINEITEFADKQNIPVIFNAVGIEGYSESDSRCQLLKEALNRRCVKAISTRDNIKLLSKKYIERRTIRQKRVCDPALWSVETYGVEADHNAATIGIGVIRPEIFGLYGVDASKATLLDFYRDLVIELEARGREYRFFTNGARRDHRFIDEIRTHLGRGSEFEGNVESIPKTGKDLVTTIGKYERIISSRMHAGIIAYSLGIPNVSVVWNKKQEYFANLTDQWANLIHTEDLSAPRESTAKLLQASPPKRDSAYKRTDYDFISREVRRYYRLRYVAKGKRYMRAKHQQLVKSVKLTKG